jgi:hypothetical protein
VTNLRKDLFFNHSPCEYIIQACVHKSVPKDQILARYRQINNFERLPVNTHSSATGRIP